MLCALEAPSCANGIGHRGCPSLVPIPRATCPPAARTGRGGGEQSAGGRGAGGRGRPIWKAAGTQMGGGRERVRKNATAPKGWAVGPQCRKRCDQQASLCPIFAPDQCILQVQSNGEEVTAHDLEPDFLPVPSEATAAWDTWCSSHVPFQAVGKPGPPRPALAALQKDPRLPSGAHLYPGKASLPGSRPPACASSAAFPRGRGALW